MTVVLETVLWPPLSTLLILSVNTVTAVSCAALFMLILWQDIRQRSNQLFALAMLSFCLFGASSLLFYFNYLLDYPYSAPTILHINASLYGLGIITLFVFVTTFSKVRGQRLLFLQVSGVLITVFLFIQLWRGQIYTNIQELSDHMIGFSLAPFGVVALVLLGGFQLVAAFILYRQTPSHSYFLWQVSLLLPLSMLLDLVPALQYVPVNALFMLIVALVTARAVVREQVFVPLVDVNMQLAAANTELQQANTLKSQFLANMSHELRTPLNSIIGYTDLVTNGTYGALSEKQLDRLEKVGRNGRRLLALINDVLDLSKIEAGHMTLSREAVNPADVLNTVLEMYKPQMEAKGLQLQRPYLNPQTRSMPMVLADPNRLEQIFGNIVSNAIKFTPAGSITIEVLRKRDDVLVSVSDTGIGIKREKFDAVFEAFQQVDNSTTRQYEGTGLGMALTKHLVEMHGGRVWFESDGTPGQGTTFFVALPVAPDQAQAIRPQTGMLGPTILCVDDTRESLEVLHGMLEIEGYRVYGANNGFDGLQRARELIPDLILLDVTMPQMDGWQVLEALRNDTRTARVPVVMIASTDQSTLARALGAVGSLIKPLVRADLIIMVRRALQQH